MSCNQQPIVEAQRQLDGHLQHHNVVNAVNALDALERNPPSAINHCESNDTDDAQMAQN